MAQVNLLVVLALAIAGCHAVPFVPIVVAGGFGAGPTPGYPRGPMTLTCAVNFTDPYHPNAGIVNAIAVTISERQNSQGNGFGFGPYGGVGHTGPHGGLSANIDVYSAAGGEMSIAFTEKARPERGCFAEDFGYFYTGDDHSVGTGSFLGFGHSLGGLGGYGGFGGVGGYGGFGGYGSGYGGFGGYGGYGGYGAYGVSPYGGVGGIGGIGAIGGFGSIYGHNSGGHPSSGYEDEPVPGVIADVDLTPGTASSVNIDSVAGFSQLKDLSGRGVVVCPKRAVDGGYGGARCEGGIIACCALHYDMGDQKVMVGRPGYP